MKDKAGTPGLGAKRDAFACGGEEGKAGRLTYGGWPEVGKASRLTLSRLENVETIGERFACTCEKTDDDDDDD